ncbi:sensor histidine kinase [Natronosalvus halobius]|uniref:sensor histidine kinase n=1 Tax=Natronosalvus halobius TaxID=2953746 RepID=UPI00209D8474|nr:HAMP domain-containing sensor histidine kinase [Natronosalvus halobius]USZ73211.1 HAMP domain-containing histidine kinase [Natronosalvus halobius]
MGLENRRSLTAAQIAGIYAIVSGLWVVLTDRFLEILFPTIAAMSVAQTAKGLVFILASTIIIYALVARSRHELEETNRRLDLALRHSSVLHRVLRHNLRNTCNVIQGTAETLQERTENVDGSLEIIEEEAERLVSIGDKSRSLESVIGTGPQSRTEVDLAEIVEEYAEIYRQRFPSARIETDVPETARFEAHPKVELAIDELLENAIVHHGSPEPVVRLAVDRSADGHVAFEVVDDGVGIPATEREALETAVEDQLVHASGVGLWLAQILVLESGGTFEVSRADAGGTTVRAVF